MYPLCQLYPIPLFGSPSLKGASFWPLLTFFNLALTTLSSVQREFLYYTNSKCKLPIIFMRPQTRNILSNIYLQKNINYMPSAGLYYLLFALFRINSPLIKICKFLWFRSKLTHIETYSHLLQRGWQCNCVAQQHVLCHILFIRIV